MRFLQHVAVVAAFAFIAAVIAFARPQGRTVAPTSATTNATTNAQVAAFEK